jgi:hypothetical protein
VDELLKVGRPATANGQWIPKFLAYCKRNALSVDFVSTHHSPTDAFGNPGADTVKPLGTELLEFDEAQAMVKAWVIHKHSAATIVITNLAMLRPPIQTELLELRRSGVPAPRAA